VRARHPGALSTVGCGLLTLSCWPENESKKWTFQANKTARALIQRLRARARAAYHLGRAIACNRLNRLTYPSVCHLLVTWRCNLRCHSCNIWKEDLYPELPTTQMLQVLEQLRFLDIIKVSGGEPFLRDDLDTLVDAMQRHIRPMMLQIISNGTCVDRMVRLVERLGNPSLYIRISLEGTSATHNRLRGRPWAFQRAWEALQQLAPLRRTRGFHLGINYTLCEETLPHLPRVLTYCRREQIDLVPGFVVYPFMEDRSDDRSEDRSDDTRQGRSAPRIGSPV